MVWMCEQLGLPDPEIETVADAESVSADADRYLEYVLERWRTQLAGVPEEAFFNKAYKTWWNVDYCIDAFMEHAVMHPIRHRFQLAEWS